MVEVNVKMLSEQLDAVQAVLDEIRVTCGCSVSGLHSASPAERGQNAWRTAKKAYLDRQSRSAYVGLSEIFGERAWDLLLELFIKQAENEAVALESANSGRDGRISTELRWLKVLELHGLIVYRADPDDNARLLIHLTPTGHEGMLGYLESIAT